MKNALKKAISVLLVAFMVFGTASLAGFVGLDLPELNLFSTKAEAVTHSGTCGDNLTWNLDIGTGVLIINGTDTMTDYSTIYQNENFVTTAPWGKYISSIKSVIISDSVTSIGKSAFAGCLSLANITIHDSVTIIGESAFSGCDSLTNVTIPDGVTIIGESAFFDCDSLVSVTIPDGVTSIGYDAFYHCSKLESVTIGNGITSISNSLFASCVELKSVTIPDGVTSIEYAAFRDCVNLVSVTIPDSITNINYAAFDGCYELDSVYYRGTPEQWRTIQLGNSNHLISVSIICECDSERTYFGGTCGDNIVWRFYGDIGELIISGTGNMDSWGGTRTEYPSGQTYRITAPWSEHNLPIKSVTISDGITSIGDYAFYSCSGLKNVTIPDSVTSIGDYAFYSCSGLKNVTIPDSVTSIGDYAFYYCSNLKLYYVGTLEQWVNITLGSNNSSMTNNLIFECDSDKPYNGGICGENLVWKFYISTNELVISGTGEMYRYIVDVPWYSKRLEIKTVSIGEGTTFICSKAFIGCKNLESITIPSSVTSIGVSAFDGCDNLKDVYYTGTLTDWCGITYSVYGGSVPNPMSYAKNLYISGKLLKGDIVIPNEITTIKAGAFYRCFGITSVTLHEDITSIEKYAFSCYPTIYYVGTYEQWGKISIGSDVYIGDIIFECDSPRPYYRSGVCGESLKWKLYTDGELEITGTGAMTNWSSSSYVPWYGLRSKIEKVTISESVESIGSCAFYNFAKLEKITIPENIQSINSNAFSICANLEKVEILSYSVEIADNAFSNSPNVILYCKSGSTVQSYAELNNIMYVLIDGSTADFAVKNNQLVAYKGSSANPKIPSGVTSIGANAFKGNETVKTLELPVSVNSIFSGAFADCSALEEIFIPHTVTTIATDAFNGTNAKIVCYANSTAHQFAIDNGIEFELVRVNLNDTQLVLKVGEYSIITATPEQDYIDSVELSWESSDTSIATVDGNGKVTAKSNGEVTISAIAPNGATLATCSVNVIPNEYNVSWVVEGNTTIQVYEVGETIVAPATPIKNGYRFVGWTPSVPSTMPNYDLTFTAVFEVSGPVNADVVNRPTQTTISYGDSIVLHVDASKIPVGGRVEWTASNGNFSYSANGTTCEIRPEKSGDTTFTATIYDAKGNAVSNDEQTMTSKAGFFDKIIAFFKKLFGATKVIPQAFKGIY